MQQKTEHVSFTEGQREPSFTNPELMSVLTLLPFPPVLLSLPQHKGSHIWI